MKFDIDSARQAGYSDDEIADYLASQNNFDLSGAIQSGYSPRDVIDFLSKKSAEPTAAPAPQPAPEEPGLISRALSAAKEVGNAVLGRDVSPAVREGRSVLEGYQTTPQEKQAAAERRLSYGAGPISSETAAKADLVRSGMAKPDSNVVQRAAEGMQRVNAPSFGELASRVKQQQDLEQNEGSYRRKAFAEENPMLAALGSGSAMSLAGAINIPTVAADFLNQSAVNPVLRALNLPELQRVPQMIGTEYLTKTAADFMPDIGNKSMKGAWNRDEFLPWLGVKLAANSPQIAQSLAAAFAPPLRAVLLPSMAGTAAGQSFVEGDDSRVAVAKGAVEYATEKLPLQAFDKIGDVLKSMGPTKSATVLAVAGQRLLQSGGVITANGLTNAIEETAAQLGGNVLDKYFQGKDIELTKGLDEAAVVGAATGKVMSAPQVAGVATGAFDPASQIARAMNQEIANTEFSVPASEVAVDFLNPNSYDQRLISPTETSRPGRMMNFTEPDSATARAGLTPIVVPVPDAPAEEVPTVGQINPETERAFGLDQLRMGSNDVSTIGRAGAATQVGGVDGRDQRGQGLAAAGSDLVRTGELGGADTAGVPAAAGADLVAGGAAAQRQAGVTPAENNNAVVEPVEQWFGRKGDGYLTETDAQQALPGRQRMFKELDWKIEQMPNGKYRLAGYAQNVQVQTEASPDAATGRGLPGAGSSAAALETTGLNTPTQETTLGTQATQAIQGQTQGQEATAAVAPGSGPVAATGATGAPAQLQGGRVPGLSPAPTAPIREFVKFQRAVAADGIEIAPLRAAEMNTQHQVASAVARVLGKTYTVARVTSGDPLALSNGMIDKLGGKHIVAAENSDDAPLFVAIHEAYHGLPEQQRKQLNTQLLQLFRSENKARFLKEFNYSEDRFDEEAPAFMAQVISKRADFWEELRTKMGNREFADVARLVLGTLNQIVRKVSGQYGQDFADTYISDIVKARDLLTTAYAEAMQAQGLTPDVEAEAGVMASQRGVDIGAALQQRIDSDFDGAAQEYAQLKGTKGGRLLDTDIARELSPEYRENRNRSAEVHEAASEFIQRSFEQRMAQPGTGDIVVFMAGGGGSGKSSAETLLAPVLDRASTVYDGTLSSYDKARRNVQLALDSGRQVRIAYVYREPEEAMRNGVLTRAMRSGRTVPVDALVKGHAGSSNVVRKLQADFGDNPKFKIFAVDNSRGPGAAQITPLENITPVMMEGLKERFINATEDEYKAGRISESVYRATLGRQADAGAGAEGQAGSREVRPGSRGDVQEGRGFERAGNPVSKDEAVVDGVVYSSKRRTLVDIPTIELKDLVGKKVVGIKADLTDAGRSYTGIDGSQLEFPVEMMGGPNYVRLPENAKANVVWAVRGGATLTKIMSQVEKSDYVLVHAMNGNSHLTNSTISTAYLQTVEAYLRDGRISRENLVALDEIVRSPKNKSGLPDFPGFESPEIYSYIDSLTFDQRGALAQILEKKEAQVHGLPNLERFRRETIDPDFAGYRQGDAMLVIKVDKENPTVKLGENGTKLHPSYPLGLRGTVIGKLAKGINYELIFRDYFKFAVPNFKNGEAGAWYAFDRKMPIQKITQEIADSVAPGGYSAIKTARQAEAALNFANNNWLVSGKTKAQGGVSVQEFVDALQANEGAAALTLYSAEEVKAGIKAKTFTVYQLGKEGGDKGLQIFFGLKRGTPWYKDMIEGVGDDEVEVVSVTNNESGAPGIGIPAIITKAISEGATLLDAFAVKSARFPNGFLPEMYAQFGFEEIGRIPFDPSYYDANGLADLKAFWSRGGWKESDGFPDVVVMRWKGNNEDRATAIDRYVRTGETGVSSGDARFNGSPTEDAHGQRDQSRAEQGGAERADGGQARGNQRAGNAASVVTRAYDSIQELARLGAGDIRNLGLDPAEVERLRNELAGVQRSNRSAELARGPSARPDAGDGATVTGIHYGRVAGLSRLSGTSFGTGIKGAEQARLNEPGVDPRIKKRVYFYLTTSNTDMPRPEIGLGSHVYRASLGNMYDPSRASPEAAKRVRELMQGVGANAFESAVLDAGYRGYVNREMQTIVVLNADVPVAYEGMANAGRMRDRIAERTVQGPVTRTEGDELVRKPTNDEMLGIIKARPALATAAPSFKLQFGDARVNKAEAEAADRALAEAGASFQFGEVMRSNRATSLEEDLKRQQLFLQERAQSAGFADIEEFVANDYEGFVAAAKEWRSENEIMFSNRVTPADRIKWRKISDVRQEIGLDALPRHIIPFANFMRTMSEKAANGDLTARDLVKAYTIARSSMNRTAVTTDRVRQSGLVLPANFSDSKIRPEGAFGYWLLSDVGQRYLNAAERQEVDADAIADAVKVMAPFGTQNALGKDLERAASGDLHRRLPAMAAAIVKAASGKNAVKDWQDATDNLYGVREAKKGFFGSLLGFGQLPTFDARQININVASESKEDTLRALSSTKARDVVAKLSRRMDALSLTMDPQYAPFYRHLVHHAVWDAVGKTETTHEDVMESMVMASNRARQTETPEFKRWFGDSKIVDAESRPLVVYHGTGADITAFAPEKSADGVFHFAIDTAMANRFAVSRASDGVRGANVMPVYLAIKNPKRVAFISTMEIEAAKAEGHDGLIAENRGHLVAFEPEQIKSAIGNSGEFDPANPDIRRSNRARDSWFLGRDELGRIKLGAGAKAYRAVADLANNVLDRLSMKPIGKDLSRAMRQMKVEIDKAREITAEVAGKLGELSQQEREMISDVIEQELKRGAKPPKRVLEIAASMQSIMSEQTAELVRLGMLSEEAAGRWDGKYLPRFYESKFKDEGKAWAKAAKSLFGRTKTMQGIGGSSLKGRGLFQTIPVDELEAWLAEGWEERDPDFDPDTDTEITVWRDYTREERENMGEIRDSMFRFVMGYSKSQRDISLGRLYENLANTVASRTEREGYVQVPTTNVEDTRARRYGKLAGKWVPKEVLDHLSGFDETQNNELLGMYRKAMSMWKEGKTVLNPVSHANNVLSNVTMAHFAGVSYWDVNKYLAATRDIVKNAPMMKEAKDAGLWLGTMTQAELVQMLPDQLKVLAAKTESKSGKVVDTVWNAMSFWLRKPMGKAYEAEDLFFRYLIYRDARQRGLDPADAVDYAQKYIFTYDDLPKGARRVRDFALPFFAYTYKVVPTLAQTALEHPWRLAAPAAILYSVNAAMYAIAAGADDDDWMELIQRYLTDEDFREKARKLEAEERVNLPPWMKGSTSIATPKAIRLGTDEATGLPVFLDLARIFPGGDLFDAHNNAGGVPLLAPITPNHPILTSAAAILFNKDTFRGTEIVKASDTDEEAAAKRAKWAYQQVAPAIAIGNGHFDRAMNVIANVTGEPVNLYFTEYTGVDRGGLPVQPKYAAMQTVGIKARPIDLETSAAIQKAQQNKLVREIEAEIRSAQRLERRGALTPDQADKIIERQKEKRQRLQEGLTVDGDEQE